MTNLKKERTVKGYYINKKTGNFVIKLMTNGRLKYIGTAYTEEDARKMYEEAKAKNPKGKMGPKPTLKFSNTKDKDYDFTGTPWYGL
jgi:hypothetical protein